MATNDHTCRKSWGKRRGYWCCKHDKTSQIDRIWLTTYIDSSIRKNKSDSKVIFCCQNSWYYCRLQYMDRKWQDAAISCMKDPCLIASQLKNSSWNEPTPTEQRDQTSQSTKRDCFAFRIGKINIITKLKGTKVHIPWKKPCWFLVPKFSQILLIVGCIARHVIWVKNGKIATTPLVPWRAQLHEWLDRGGDNSIKE